MVKDFLVVLAVAALLITLPVAPLATSNKRDHLITIKNKHHISEPLVDTSINEDDYDFNDYDSVDKIRFIETNESEEGSWVTEDEILDLIRDGVKFMDVTDHLDLGKSMRIKKTRSFPVSPAYQTEVLSFIANLTTKHMEANLRKFTSFRNRYYKSATGRKSSEWLYKQILRIVEEADDDVDVSVRKFKHNWEQRSIIARFEGSDSDLDEEVVIVGAHQDSINMWYPTLPAPGADDDGSGTVTILEAFRVLVEGGFKPVRPVEFHWYSAEEGGLLGSQDIAHDYEKEGKDVVAMLQNDMTGYVGKNKQETFGIIIDFVDPALTDFTKSLVDTYASIPWHDTKCGYACSDHASWRKAGYPSAFAIESEFHDSNPYIHTTNDVVENLSFDHMLEFSKLSVSFAVELSHI